MNRNFERVRGELHLFYRLLRAGALIWIGLLVVLIFQRISWDFRAANLTSKIQIGDSKSKLLSVMGEPDRVMNESLNGQTVQYHAWGLGGFANIWIDSDGIVTNIKIEEW